MERSAGILLSVTSLPSPYGIGTIGKEAREFADFLKRQVRRYGRFFLSALQATVTLLISPFQLMQVTLT